MTDEELFEQEMEIEARDAYEAEIEANKRVPVVFVPETGQVELVWDPMRKGHLIWIPF